VERCVRPVSDGCVNGVRSSSRESVVLEGSCSSKVPVMGLAVDVRDAVEARGEWRSESVTWRLSMRRPVRHVC
jgi:hypothetical protein